MRGILKVLKQSDYSAWIAAKQQEIIDYEGQDERLAKHWIPWDREEQRLQKKKK